MAYRRRAQETIKKHFKKVAVSLGQEKKRVFKCCQDLRLSRLAKTEGAVKDESLRVFLTAKAHKDKCLLGQSSLREALRNVMWQASYKETLSSSSSVTRLK